MPKIFEPREKTMKLFYRTTALAALLGASTMGVAAQENGQSQLQSGDYCNMQWTQVDADGDGFVSKQEAQDHLELSFAAVDQDFDGNITEVEYIDCQTGTPHAPLVSPGPGDEASFREVDTDEDQQVDRAEYAEAARRAYEAVQSEVSEENYKSFASYTWLTREELGATDTTIDQMTADEAAFRSATAFNAIDQNGDDVIGREEWQGREDVASYDEAWAKARFSRLDADQSGAINMDEFVKTREDVIDNLTATANDADAGENNQSTSSSSASDSDGTPVYLYHFWIQ